MRRVMGALKCVGLILCLVSVVLLSGCAGFAISHPGGEGKAVPAGVSQGILFGDVTYPCFINSRTEVQLDTDDFDILQTVTAESSSTNVLGLFSEGDSGYGALFAKAKAAGGDDVINVKADTRLQSYVIGFYTKATTMITGTAIRWKKK